MLRNECEQAIVSGMQKETPKNYAYQTKHV